MKHTISVDESMSDCLLFRYRSDESARSQVGTAALLDYLESDADTNIENKTVFFFCLGADAFLDLMASKWKESDRVLQLLDGGRHLVVLHRSLDGDLADNDANDNELRRRVQETGARLLRVGHLGSISSSQVRACSDVEQLRTMVAPKVLNYMQLHCLYQFAANDSSSASQEGEEGSQGTPRK